jgi:hypothetical protein
MVVREPPLSTVLGIKRFKTHGIILFMAKDERHIRQLYGPVQ